MIVGVTGILAETGEDWVHLTVGGVTLRVMAPASEILTIGPEGSAVTLFTHLRIRDEQPILYGFTSQAALDLFLATQGVTGVGPRLGLALVSGLGATGLQRAIALGDTAKLSGVSGVGRRTADRIVLELKGKVGDVDVEQEGGETDASNADGELIEILRSMGYTTAEVRRALASLDRSADQTVEDYLRQALQHIGGW